MLNDMVALPSIAYFPMEIALQNHIPTFSSVGPFWSRSLGYHRRTPARMTCT
jgi:hypothetical protein